MEYHLLRQGMFGIEKVLKSIKKLYSSGEIFKAFIEKRELFPLEFKLKRVSQKDIQNSFSQLQKEIKKLKELHLKLIFKEFHFKSIGTQKLPYAIVIDFLDEFLKVIGKEKEYQDFVLNYEYIVKKYPPLQKLFLQKPFLVLEYIDIWDRLLRVVDFFIKKEALNIYIREISIDEVDTKFIENHKKILDLLISTIKNAEPLKSLKDFSFEKRYFLKYPQALVRFRAKKRYFGFEDISLPMNEFKNINASFKRVFVIENKTTFLSFPLFEDAIVIFGEGYGVAKLQNIEWLKSKEIFYWGDIDIDGFAILSQFRGYYMQTKSIFMDIDTFNRFKNF